MTEPMKTPGQLAYERWQEFWGHTQDPWERQMPQFKNGWETSAAAGHPALMARIVEQDKKIVALQSEVDRLYRKHESKFDVDGD